MAVLDLRGFRLLFLIFIVYSCTTPRSEEYIKKELITVKNSNEITPKFDNDIEILPNNKVDDVSYITNGSISVMSLLGNDLWIGKLGGELLRYNLYTKELTKFLDDNYSIIDFSIKNIIDMPTKVIALQSDRVIEIKKSNESIKITTLPSEISRTSDIIQYKDKIYISTLGYGLREYDSANNTFYEIIPNVKYISSLLIEDDILYIGSMDNGLYMYDLRKNSLLSRLNFPPVLFNKNIIKLKKKYDILWIGTTKNGLIKWNTKTDEVMKIYPKESVSSIFLGENGINTVSFIGLGVYFENDDIQKLESIDTILQTNNVTSVAIFDNYFLTGNIKKGIILQEIKL